MNTPKHLFRSNTDKMIAGVCGGLAQYLAVDPTIVRLVFLLLFFLGGSAIPIYLIMWVITPIEP
jgi:phage shock protein C